MDRPTQDSCRRFAASILVNPCTMLLQGANSSELKVALKARMDALGEVLSEQERQQVRVREYVYVFWAGIISYNFFVRTGSCKPVITSMVVMPVVATAGQGDCLGRQTSKSNP